MGAVLIQIAVGVFRLFFDIKVTRSSAIRSSGCTVDRTTLNVIIVLIYISGERDRNLLVSFNFKALVFCRLLTSSGYLARFQSNNYRLVKIHPLQTRYTTHPSGSKMNAIFLIFPSLGFFLNCTPSCSKRSQAFSTSSTVMAMWPNPLPGSVFPLA